MDRICVTWLIGVLFATQPQQRFVSLLHFELVARDEDCVSSFAYGEVINTHASLTNLAFFPASLVEQAFSLLLSPLANQVDST